VQTVPAGALLRSKLTLRFYCIGPATSGNTRRHEVTRNRDWNRVVDISLPERQENVIRFTFLDGRKSVEGRDYTVNVRQEDAAAKSRRNLRRRKRPASTHPQSDKSQLRSSEIDLGIAQGGPQHHPRGVSILTILQFDTLLLIFGQLCGGI